MKTRQATLAKSVERGTAPSVHRCDRLPVHANVDKADAVRAMLKAWREAAGTVAASQWRLFQATGRFDAVADPATEHRRASAAIRSGLIRQIALRHGAEHTVPLSGAPQRLARPCPGFADPAAVMKADLGAAQTQMVRRQVVGMLESFVSNRQNDFRRTVFASSLNDDRRDLPEENDDAATSTLKAKRLKARRLLRHMLFAVNLARAWFDLKREVVVASVEGRARDTVVPPDVRRLARRIMSSIMGRHHRPSTRRIGMTVDRRIATLEPARSASAFPLWLRLTVGRGKMVSLPLRTTPPFVARQGERSLSFNVQADHATGRLTVGVTHDVGETCRVMRDAYAASASGTLRLDFGLRTLFVSDRGDLVGRDFMDRLLRLDRTIQGIARHIRRTGGRPRSSERYRRHVARLRGFVTTMVNWALTRLVMKHRPEALVLERLDFRSLDLSKRMNRLLSVCGRGAVKNKLRAMEEELGLVATTEPCAYTSQTCSGCGYADRRNRKGQAFECLWCGKKMHADANAATNLGSERFRPATGLVGRAARDAVLATLVTGHRERWPMERCRPIHGRTRGSGAPPDPRSDNPYFTGRKTEARSRAAKAAQSCRTGRRRMEVRATQNAT